MNDPEIGLENKRKFRRRRTLIGGMIYRGADKWSCSISDISESGVRVKTDAEIEQVKESIKKYEARPGVVQAAGFGEALNHEHRNLARLQDYRSQVSQIARDLGLDVTGLNDTR